MKSRTNRRYGNLEPMYNFSMNPYPEFRFYRCPDCRDKTGQRTLPLVICVFPRHFISLNFTNRYCRHCDTLIGKKDEIEHCLTELFVQNDPSVIGNEYVMIGTMEKKAWRKNLENPGVMKDDRPYIHDFKSFEEIRMTMAGWFKDGVEPPVMPPPPSTEWVK